MKLKEFITLIGIGKAQLMIYEDERGYNPIETNFKTIKTYANWIVTDIAAATIPFIRKDGSVLVEPRLNIYIVEEGK